jgi:hypothetical protein
MRTSIAIPTGHTVNVSRNQAAVIKEAHPEDPRKHGDDGRPKGSLKKACLVVIRGRTEIESR